MSLTRTAEQILDDLDGTRYMGDPGAVYAHRRNRGTVRGWHWHRRRHETPCDLCVEARRDYHRTLDRRIPAAEKRRRLAAHTGHGTRTGYLAHLARGEATCGECRAAHAAYARKRWPAERQRRQERRSAVAA